MRPALSTLQRVLSVAYVLGVRDIKRTYRDSKLGFFRLFLMTILSLIIIVPIFATVQGRDLSEFLPYVASGLIIWSFISDAVIDGSSAYMGSMRIIRQIAIPRVAFVLQGTIRNAIMLGLSLLLFPFIAVISKLEFSFNVLLLPFGLLITIVTVMNFSVILATMSARIRDLPAITAAVMRVLFFLSPIIWVTDRIQSDIAHLILGLNPFYHLLQIVRLPLLGEVPTLTNWLLSIFAATFSAVIAWIVFKKFDHKIAYWV